MCMCVCVRDIYLGSNNNILTGRDTDMTTRIFHEKLEYCEEQDIELYYQQYIQRWIRICRLMRMFADTTICFISKYTFTLFWDMSEAFQCCLDGSIIYHLVTVWLVGSSFKTGSINHSTLQEGLNLMRIPVVKWLHGRMALCPWVPSCPCCHEHFLSENLVASRTSWWTGWRGWHTLASLIELP